MPDLASLRARVEFDTRPLDVGAKTAASTIVSIGTTAKGTTAAVRELGAATDTAGASAGRAAGSAKAEASSLQEVKQTAEGAAAGTASYSKATDQAAASANTATAANKALASSLSPSAMWGGSTVAAKAHAAQLAAVADASAKAAAAETELADQSAAASKRAGEFAADLAAVAWKSKAAGEGVDGFASRLKKIDTSLLSEVGRGLSYGVTVPLLGLGAASIKSAITLDNLKRGLTSVTGSSAETERQLVRLQEIAKLPGLGFKEAVQGSIRLQAAGFSAAQAEKSLSAFGNAVASAGGGKAELEGVTLALMQIASKGKISAEEINQLSERVPQVRKAMLAAFGTADTEALQKRKISATEFVDTLTAELGKIPSVTSGAGNSFETLSDNIEISLARIAKGSLPIVAKVADQVADAVEKASKTFESLPSPAQNAVLGFLALTAAAGPLITVLTKAIDLGTKFAGLKGILGLGGKAAAIPALSDFAGVGGAAAGASAGTIGAALAGGAVATAGGAYAAREADKHGALGLAGGNIIESMFGGAINPVTIARHWEAIQGALGFGKDTVKGNGAEFGPPRPDAKPSTTPPVTPPLSDEDRAKFEKARGLDYEASVNAAKSQIAAGDESTKQQREAKTLAPILEARRQDLLKQAAELKPKIKEDADAALAYARFQKEATELQEQTANLQRDAAKEIAANQKKAATAAKAHQREQFALRSMALDNSVLAARAASAGKGEAEDGDPNLKAIRENELMRPVLTAKQRDIVTQWKGLVASGARDPETTKEALQLQADWFNLEKEKGTNAAAAAKAEAAIQKKAGEEAVKAFQARLQVSKDQAIARASEAMPGYEARGLVNELTPVLEQEQAELLADLKNYKVGSQDYWKATGEVEKSKRELAKLEQNAAKEAANEQKKTLEETKKAHRERLQLMSAETRLIELQLKNNPLLTERQRKGAANDLLAQQYAAAMRPDAGETRTEKINRLTEAEQLKGQIFDNIKAMGGGRGNLIRAGWQLDQLASQGGRAQDRLADVQRAAKVAQAQAPGVLVVQVIRKDDSPASIAQAVAEAQRQQRSNSGLVGAGRFNR